MVTLLWGVGSLVVIAIVILIRRQNMLHRARIEQMSFDVGQVLHLPSAVHHTADLVAELSQATFVQIAAQAGEVHCYVQTPGGIDHRVLNEKISDTPDIVCARAAQRVHYWLREMPPVTAPGTVLGRLTLEEACKIAQESER